jgi:hypothetical protein
MLILEGMLAGSCDHVQHVVDVRLETMPCLHVAGRSSIPHPIRFHSLTSCSIHFLLAYTSTHCLSLPGLDSLKLHLNGAPAAKSMLPQQLTRLKISTRDYGADPGLQHLGIDSLQQLVTLEVSNGMLELQLMHRVACLPKLQHVLLRYTYGSVALRSATILWG